MLYLKMQSPATLEIDLRDTIIKKYMSWLDRSEIGRKLLCTACLANPCLEKLNYGSYLPDRESKLRHEGKWVVKQDFKMMNEKEYFRRK